MHRIAYEPTGSCCEQPTTYIPFQFCIMHNILALLSEILMNFTGNPLHMFIAVERNAAMLCERANDELTSFCFGLFFVYKRSCTVHHISMKQPQWHNWKTKNINVSLNMWSKKSYCCHCILNRNQLAVAPFSPGMQILQFLCRVVVSIYADFCAFSLIQA